MRRSFAIIALSIISSSELASSFQVGQKKKQWALRPTFDKIQSNDIVSSSPRSSSFGMYHVSFRRGNTMKAMDHRYSTDLQYIGRDADYGEILAGGERYAMVELPDSMVDTTIFVGNLCEFVTDDMLSTLFQEVSSLNFVPACVARKANMSSLKYGFVTFPTVSEKEAAIIKFTGYELNDKKIRVEEIQDHKFRVRVPEKLVVYAVGELKRTREGTKNTMRKVSNSREPEVHGNTSSMMSISSSSKSNGRRNFKNQRRNKKKANLSSSSMLGSDVVRKGGYKNMKRREKRKQRRTKSHGWDDYGLR